MSESNPNLNYIDKSLVKGMFLGPNDVVKEYTVKVSYTSPYELKRGTEYSAGLDLIAQGFVTHGDMRPTHYIPMKDGACLVNTGVRLFFHKQSPDFHAQLSMRSSAWRKFGLIMVNAPGIIDSDYTGELMLSVFQTVDIPAMYNVIGEAMGQITFINCVPYLERVSTDEFNWLVENRNQDVSIRGSGGFGSTDR